MIKLFENMSILLLSIYFFMTYCLGENICPPRASSGTLSGSDEQSLLFYVDANHGDDVWSGRLLKSNLEGTDGPFKTISGAISGIQLQRKTLNKPATLYVRGGIYFVKEKIILRSKDSNYLNIIGYPGDERPIISGAIRIPGSHFYQFDEKVWAAPFSGSCTKHVFIGTKRLVRARKPNLESWNGNELSGQGPYLTIKDLLVSTPKCNRAASGGFKQNCPSENKRGFIFEKGDINPDWVSPERGSTADILVFHAWTAERGHIKEITDDKVYFRNSLRKAIGTSPKPSGWRYIVENVREELDTVGEFFCDERKGMLYLIPPKGYLELFFDVYVAQASTLFSGTTGTKNIKFIDIDFRHTHDNNVQLTNPAPAVLEFRSCDKIQIYRCSFINIGYSALFFGSSINSEVTESKFFDVGNYGIATSFSGNPKSIFATKNIIIDNNTFKGCGVTAMLQPACIFVQGVSNIKVTRNDVSITPYAGIRAGWQDTFTQNFLPKDEYIFTISSNNIHDFGMGILNDFGGIYMSSNRKCGNDEIKLDQCHLPSLITDNTIHHSKPYWYGGIGVFGDTGVSSLSVKNNWIYNLHDCAVNFHCGQNNKAINNMIYHTNNKRIFGTCKPIGPGIRPPQTVTLKQNVVYVANSDARMYSRADFWNDHVPVVNQNAYFFNPYYNNTVQNFFPKSLSLEEWRMSTGNDKDSIITDPIFENTNEDDFRLNQNSPALNIGIKSVDLRKVRTESGICSPKTPKTSNLPVISITSTILVILVFLTYHSYQFYKKRQKTGLFCFKPVEYTCHY